MASWPMVYNSLPGYAGFTNFTPTIPKLYWDVYSQEERIKRICMELHKVVEYASAMNENIELNHEMIDKLAQEFEKFKNSGFFDYYAAQLEEWINLHMPTLIAQAMKMVWFRLTDMTDDYPGYFVAYIPDSWQDITFTTSMNDEDYGCLILVYTEEETYYTPSKSYDVLDDLLNEINGKITENADNITVNANAISNAETQLNNHDARITENTNNITINTNAISNAETRLDNHDARITENANNIAENADNITVNANAISNAETRLDNHDTRITENANNITVLNTFMESAETDLAHINTTLYTNLGE